MFGPKKFEKWLFTVDKDIVIEIKTNIPKTKIYLDGLLFIYVSKS